MAARLTPAEKLAQIKEQQAAIQGAALKRLTVAQQNLNKREDLFAKAQENFDAAQEALDSAWKDLADFEITPENIGDYTTDEPEVETKKGK